MKIRCPFCTQTLDLRKEEEPLAHIADHFQKVREAAAEVADEQLELEPPTSDEAGNHISER